MIETQFNVWLLMSYLINICQIELNKTSSQIAVLITLLTARLLEYVF